MKIIPAIDIINGQCVRLSEGKYDTKKVYYENPLEAAQSFEEAGLKYLHVVDLDGAKAGKVMNWDVLKSICSNTSLNIDFSGGIKTIQEAEKAFDLGAKQIAIGSLAVKQPETVMSWLVKFGCDKIIIGADVKDKRIAIHGWQETADYTVFEFIDKYHKAGAIHFLCTDVSKDGKLEGPAVDLYKEIIEQFPDIDLIASGGVSSMDDFNALQSINCRSVIVGKAIYENKVSIEDLAKIQS
ncbi:MAG: 1-(5-phosphoribosyl)-5-[(5-phosphoribosylamino)methylideneamino]imidazole-4-carboxamide isomerase [Chitinophagales bacterium]